MKHKDTPSPQFLITAMITLLGFFANPGSLLAIFPSPLIPPTVPSSGDTQFFGFGWNGYGQLGLGEAEYFDSPTAIPSQGYVELIATNALHSLFTDTKGQLWGMGYNQLGQLGLGDSIDRKTPTQIPTSGPVKQISVGAFHSLFITNDGTLYGMGDNTFGVLGLPDKIDRTILSPHAITTHQPVIAASAGGMHSLFVTADGQLWGMGNSEFGQLGVLADSVATPIQIPTSLPVTAVSAGDLFSLYLTNDGTLWIISGVTSRVKSPDPSMLSPMNFAQPIHTILATEVRSFAARNIHFFGLRPRTASEGESSEEPILETKEVLYLTLATYINEKGELWGVSDRDSRLLRPTSSPSYEAFFIENNVLEADTNGPNTVFVQTDGTLWFWVGFPHTFEEDEDEELHPMSKYHLASGVSKVALGEEHLIFTLGQQINADQSFTTNPLSLNSWAIDSKGVLQPGASFSTAVPLPKNLSIEGGFLRGYLPAIGNYYFTIIGNDGINELTTTFHIRVIPPTTTPVIFGATFNGKHHPAVFISPATHGVAAVSELMNFSAAVGDPITITFEWEFIKPPFSFRIVGGALPPGLILDGDTGTIAGVATTPGEFLFVESVKDWRGRGYQWIRLQIE
jgi:hypothetical protein